MNDRATNWKPLARIGIDAASETFRVLESGNEGIQSRIVRCFRSGLSRDEQFLLDMKADVDLNHHFEIQDVLLFHAFYPGEPTVALTTPFEGVMLSELDGGAQPHLSPLSPVVAIQLAIDALHVLARIATMQVTGTTVGINISPSNIGIDGDGHVKLLARTSVRGWADIGAGYPWMELADPWRRFRAPEEFEDQEVTQASHVFSMGVLLVELLAGEPVFPHGPTKAAIDKVQAHENGWLQRQLSSALAPQFCAILEEAMRVEPEQRYETFADFADDLTQALKLFGYSRTPLEIVSAVRDAQRSTSHHLPSHINIPSAMVFDDMPGLSQAFEEDGESSSTSRRGVRRESNEHQGTSKRSGALVHFDGQPLVDSRQETLHYRTDQYRVLRGDDEEEAVELSANFIRKTVEDTQRASGFGEGESMEKADQAHKHQLIADVLAGDMPHRMTISSYLRPPAAPSGAHPSVSAEYPKPANASGEWIALDEHRIVEAEVVEESEFEAEVTSPGTTETSPKGVPAIGVDTRSSLLKELEQIHPDGPIVQAAELYENGEFDIAMPLLKAEFFGEYSLAARIVYAQCMYALGDTEEAEERFSQLLESDILPEVDEQLIQYFLGLVHESGPRTILAGRIFRKLKKTASDRFPDLEMRLERLNQPN